MTVPGVLMPLARDWAAHVTWRNLANGRQVSRKVFFFPSPSKRKTSSKMTLVLVICCSQQNAPKLSSFKQQLNITSVSVGQKSRSDWGWFWSRVSQEVAVKTSLVVAIFRGISVQSLFRWRWRRVSEVSSSSLNLQTPSPWLFPNTPIPI